MSYAIVFPGQGSQSLGMLNDLAEHPQVQQTFSQASDALGYNLWELTQTDEARLNQTEYTQPAMLTAAIAIYQVWHEYALQKGFTEPPAMLAGHSLGEYTALVVAGSFSFDDAVRVVQKRAQLMQHTVGPNEGLMAAIIGLDDDQVVDVCQQAAEGDVVQAVNFNAPGQVVIAGHKAGVERAIEQAKAAGAKRAIALPVSVPSHSLLMQPAAEALNDFLKNIAFNPPATPVIHNVDALQHNDLDEIRQAIVRQLYQPVRWVDSIRAMHKAGVTAFVECGPGRVLSGLTRRIDRHLDSLNLDSKSFEKTLNSLIDLQK